MIPGPTIHASGEGNFFSVRNFLPFAKQFATVRPGRRTRLPVVGFPLALKIQEPRNLVRAAARPLIAASARKGTLSECSTYFSDPLAD